MVMFTQSWILDIGKEGTVEVQRNHGLQASLTSSHVGFRLGREVRGQTKSA